MAFQKLKEDHNIPVQAATDIVPLQFLTFGGTSTLLAIPVGSSNVRPHWYGGLGTTASGAIVPCDEPGQIVKARAAASVGAGAEVGIASNNGAVGPITQASGTLKWAVGLTMSAAAAGEIVTVDFRPRTLGGNA